MSIHTTRWAQASTRSWRWIHFLATCISLNGESWGINHALQLCSPSLIRPLSAWVTFCDKARYRWGFPSLIPATATHRAQPQTSNTLLTYPCPDQVGSCCWRKDSEQCNSELQSSGISALQSKAQCIGALVLPLGDLGATKKYIHTSVIYFCLFFFLWAD